MYVGLAFPQSSELTAAATGHASRGRGRDEMLEARVVLVSPLLCCQVCPAPRFSSGLPISSLGPAPVFAVSQALAAPTSSLPSLLVSWSVPRDVMPALRGSASETVCAATHLARAAQIVEMFIWFKLKR